MSNPYLIASAVPGPLVWEGILRLLVAATLGALIGTEREYHGRSAGFRTQLLVALGSALAMLVSLEFGKLYGQLPSSQVLRIDPARVAYGVMGGVGFLGAGVIIHYQAGVRGLTTAASLWCTAAVGLACGVGMYGVAVIASFSVIFALFVLSKLDDYIPSRGTKTLTALVPAGQADTMARLEKLLAERGAKVVNADYERDFREQTEKITFYLSLAGSVKSADLMCLGDEIEGLIRLSIR